MVRENRERDIKSDVRRNVEAESRGEIGYRWEFVLFDGELWCTRP